MDREEASKNQGEDGKYFIGNIQWTLFNDLDQSNPNNSGAIASEEFKGHLYWGVCNWEEGPQIWRTDGVSLETVMAGGFEGEITEQSALARFGDQLYLAARNDNTGQALVWRTSNSTDWEQVGFDGFGDPGNGWTYWDNATTVFRGGLYIATINWWTGGQVWRMCWDQCEDPLTAKH